MLYLKKFDIFINENLKDFMKHDEEINQFRDVLKYCQEWYNKNLPNWTDGKESTKDEPNVPELSKKSSIEKVVWAIKKEFPEGDKTQNINSDEFAMNILYSIGYDKNYPQPSSIIGMGNLLEKEIGEIKNLLKKHKIQNFDSNKFITQCSKLMEDIELRFPSDNDLE